MRLLCYIMETDYTEALTPICISLTNLAENQIHGKDTEAGMAGKSKHGGWHPSSTSGKGQVDWLFVPLLMVSLSTKFPLLQERSRILPALSGEGLNPADSLLVAHSSHPHLSRSRPGQGQGGSCS